MLTLTSCLFLLSCFIFSADKEHVYADFVPEGLQCSVGRPRCSSRTTKYELGSLEPVQFYVPRCCGDEWYCPNIQGCCGGEVYRLHSHGCCRGELYNRNSHECCGNFIHNKGSCCNGVYYDQSTLICCGGETFPKTAPRDERMVCCNDEPYRLFESFCCGQTVYPRAGLDGHLVRCCGNTPYFVGTLRCCYGSLVPQGTPCPRPVFNTEYVGNVGLDKFTP